MQNEFNLRTILDAVAAGWRTIAVFIAVTLLLTLVILATTPPSYRVQMMMMKSKRTQIV